MGEGETQGDQKLGDHGGCGYALTTRDKDYNS